MQLNVSFDSSVSSAPSGFVAAVDYVASYFDSLFTNNVTITIDVGYGEIAGSALDVGALGESRSSTTPFESYSAVKNALVGMSAPGSSTLPSTSPLSGNLFIAQAEAKALGLQPGGVTPDGYVGFDSKAGEFGYGVGTAPPSSEYYFVGVVEHEFTEVMGRTSDIDDQPGEYTAMDLYRYAGVGQRDYSAGGSGSTAYFSTDGEISDLGTWNNQASNGDLGDWYPSGPASGGNDAFNDYSDNGVLNVMGASDVALMEALGWSTTQPPVVLTGWSFETIGDFGGVGAANDVLWENSSGQFMLFAMADGSGLQSNAYLTYDGSVAAMPSGWTYAGAGAFNGSGPTDLLFESAGGQLLEWTMSGSTIQSSAYVTYTGSLATMPAGWSLKSIADFGGAGTTDMLWESGGGQLLEFAMSGSAIQSSSYVTYTGSLVTIPSYLTIVGSGDFSGNGTSDLLLASTNREYLLLQMSGSQTVSSNYLTYGGSTAVLPSGWSYEGNADLFSTGKTTMLFESGGGQLLAFEMSGNQIVSSGYVTYDGAVAAIPTGWTFDGVGNFGGTGDNDILLRNATSGNLIVWQMQGTEITSSAYVAAISQLPSNALSASNPVQSGLASSSSAYGLHDALAISGHG